MTKKDRCSSKRGGGPVALRTRVTVAPVFSVRICTTARLPTQLSAINRVVNFPRLGSCGIVGPHALRVTRRRAKTIALTVIRM